MHLPFLIKDNQTGFIKNRVSEVNMRKLNIIQYFDRIEWPYQFSALKRFGLGGDFINLVKLIYHSPRASVIVNGMPSPEFSLSRSTRQGGFDFATDLQFSRRTVSRSY